MDLREPKRKKRVRLHTQASLPVSTNDNGEWKVYTAHLSASGTVIVDPIEMEAVYSMGFFGKGSLSRSFPSFGRRRFGAPPIIRNRQWTRRQQWLEELKNLNDDANPQDMEIDMENGSHGDSPGESIDEESGREKARESVSETNVELEKVAESKPDVNCPMELEDGKSGDENLPGESIDDESCREKVPESVLETNVELKKVTENEPDVNCPVEPEGGKSGDEKTPEFDSKAPKEPENITENKVNEDSSIELKVDKEAPKSDLKSLEELKEATRNKIDDDSCKESVEDGKSKKIRAPDEPAKALINEIEANSSIEFIGKESCVKRVKMCGSDKKDKDKRKNNTSITRGESPSVDEVLLDSTEDEEICEIVEKEPMERVIHGRSSGFDDVRVLNDEDSIIEAEENPYELLVIPDTDSDTDNYLRNVESRIERVGFPVNETLHLTFEETFFLMYGLGCLQLIHYDGSIFGINNAWNYFQQQDKYFIQKYVVYHYFRSKGWIVKPGLKFGGDFLLYKQGPPFYHASYIVVIEVMDADTLIRDDVKSMRKVTWKNLIGLERLSETIAKEILFAQILWPFSIVRNGSSMPVEALSEFTVRELLWRRWNPKRKPDIASADEEDSDSV